MREPIINQSPTEITISFDKKWLAYNHVLLTSIGLGKLGSKMDIEAHPLGTMNLPPQTMQYTPQGMNTMDGIVSKGEIDVNNEKRQQSNKHHHIWEKIKNNNF